MKYNKNEVTGKMRDRIILQNVTRVRSLTGFASEIWTDTTTIWAFAESKLPGSNETIIEGKNTAKNICDFTIRYISSITEESRVVFKNKIYQVKNIKISHDRRFISFQGVYYDSYSTVIGLQFCSASLLAQSSLSAALMRVIKYQASLNAFGSVSADIALVQKVASSLNAFGTLTGDINFVQKAQAALLTSSSVTGNIIIPKLVQASLTGAGTTAANLTVTSSASFLLDLYPTAAVAYSLRKLRSAYTGSAIRVRRSSDNTEQDIGFIGNDLDTTALTTFVGAGNGFVVTWYDQSGNANNARMTTQANQPQIVSSGSVILTNGKPSVNFDGTNDSLNLSTSLTFANTGSLISFVGKRAAAGNRLYSLSGVQYLMTLFSDNFYYLQSRTNGYQASTSTDTSTNQLLLSGVNNGTNQIIYKNNSVVASSFIAFTLPTGINNIGNYNNDGSFYMNSNLQEIIFYNFENSSNLNGINTNINTHYGIY